MEKLNAFKAKAGEFTSNQRSKMSGAKDKGSLNPIIG